MRDKPTVHKTSVNLKSERQYFTHEKHDRISEQRFRNTTAECMTFSSFSNISLFDKEGLCLLHFLSLVFFFIRKVHS